MADCNEDLGTIRRQGSQFLATFERKLDHSPVAVWAMLTEPDRLVKWLAPGTIELREGGSAKLDFRDSGVIIDSKVTAFEQDRILEYSWSSPGEPYRPLRFEIDSEGGGCRLKMHLRTPVGEDIARSCAGWEAHLMMLLAALEGVPIKFPLEHFQSSREAYNSRI